MEEFLIAVAAFIIGFVIGNLSKLEVRALLKRLVERNDKKKH